MDFNQIFTQDTRLYRKWKQLANFFSGSKVKITGQIAENGRTLMKFGRGTQWCKLLWNSRFKFRWRSKVKVKQIKLQKCTQTYENFYTYTIVYTIIEISDKKLFRGQRSHSLVKMLHIQLHLWNLAQLINNTHFWWIVG